VYPSLPIQQARRLLHHATRILIGVNSGALDSLLVKLDNASGYCTDPAFKFWKIDNYIHIKG
jgi:hypothetical protein